MKSKLEQEIATIANDCATRIMNAVKRAVLAEFDPSRAFNSAEAPIRGTLSVKPSPAKRVQATEPLEFFYRHRGTDFVVRHSAGLGWIADIDGAVPGGRTTRAKAVQMAKTWIDNNGTLIPTTPKRVRHKA